MEQHLTLVAAQVGCGCPPGEACLLMVGIEQYVGRSCPIHLYATGAAGRVPSMSSLSHLGCRACSVHVCGCGAHIYAPWGARHVASMSHPCHWQCWAGCVHVTSMPLGVLAAGRTHLCPLGLLVVGRRPRRRAAPGSAWGPRGAGRRAGRRTSTRSCHTSPTSGASLSPVAAPRR